MPKSVDTDATNQYAGPFCCGDYSCPANRDTNADCVNNDRGEDLTEPWCPCGEPDCAVRFGTGPCTYPPEHPIHH